MLELIDILFNVLNISSVLLLAALGLAIVFGLMGVINLAHGELIMIGAYTTYVVQNVFKPWGEPWFSLYILIALPFAFVVAALLGLILEKGVIRFLYGRPLETLLATWGISLILRQLVRSVNWTIAIGIAVFAAVYLIGRRLIKGKSTLIQTVWLLVSVAIAWAAGWGVAQGGSFWTRPWFSARNVDVTAPAWLRGGIPLGNFQLPYVRIFIVVITIACLVGVYWFLQRSLWGLRIRAVTQNRPMSDCLGIPTKQVDALTFAIGSGLAGIAGCAISLLGSVGPNTGQNYIVDAFMVVVVGGVGNLLGTVLAAIGIGTLNYLIGARILASWVEATGGLETVVGWLDFFATTSMAKVIVFVLIIAFLQIKPAGLFPPKGRTAEL